MERTNKAEQLPEQFATIEEAAEFWDTHDLTDYWDLTEDVDFVVNLRQRHYLVVFPSNSLRNLATISEWTTSRKELQ
jgi:hypothetical protein